MTKAKQTVFIFVGTAGSGKTTLITKFAKRKRLKHYDILTVMKPYLRRYGQVTEKNRSVLDEVVHKYVSSFSRKRFNILELATGGYLPLIIKGLKERLITVIYCNAPLIFCQKRNKKRSRNVPEHYLKYQNQFKKAFYEKLKRDLHFKLVVIDMTKKPEDCLRQLMSKIRKE